jgi:hypothetical protein
MVALMTIDSTMMCTENRSDRVYKVYTHRLSNTSLLDSLSFACKTVVEQVVVEEENKAVSTDFDTIVKEHWFHIHLHCLH